MNIEKYKKLTIPLLILIILLGLSFGIITPVLDMIILGAIFAYGLRPLSKKLESKLRFQSVSVVISIIIVLIPLIILIIYLLMQTADFALGFINTNVNNMDVNQLNIFLKENLPTTYHSYIDTIIGEFYTIFSNALHSVLNYIIGLIKSIPYISLEIFVLFFSTYYFTKDGDRIVEYIETFTPEDKKEFFNELYFQIDNVLKSIFFGHFLTAVILGIIAGVGYFLLGYPYALFLGVLTGILQLIPIFGPWPIYTVLFIWDILSGNYVRAVIVLFFGFFLSLSDMYIRPALSSKYADIHPLILFLGFVSGPLVFGIVGFIVGPLLLGITYAVIKSYKISLEKKQQDED